ncbi:mucin-3A [Orycteropus afer afer]|uniref:Mucin-3A n=1 Tax=Orycteropus afer afer TaxID=1230840 RepID=A0AC54ZCS1_ORYAF|nr:mucin-3A [Orycteropus afer afer]
MTTDNKGTSTNVPVSSLSTSLTTATPPTLITSLMPTTGTTETVSVGITSTDAVTTSFNNITSFSISTLAMSSSVSPPNTITTLTDTTSSFISSSHISSTENTVSSVVTTFPTLSPFVTTRTSSAISSLTSTLTKTTPIYVVYSTTPCPESIPITVVSASPTTPCTLSTFPSTPDVDSSPSSTSVRTLLPTHIGISTSMPLEAYPTSRPPSSINTRTTTGTWMSSNSVTTPRIPGITNLPLTAKPSTSLPTDMMTSSKLTSSTPTITKPSETSMTTTQTPSTRTSHMTTSTTTQKTTQSRLTTTPGCSCDNGGTWDQGQCLCPLGFSGDHCQLEDIMCQNGGKWDGLKCVCPSTFHGYICEFPKEQVALDTVDVEVGMEVSVDQEFSPDLNDNTSQAYRDFSTTFQNQIQKIYQNVKGFQGVEILTLRNGSIVVDYLVLLELPFSPQLDSEYEKVKTELKEELQNASKEGTDCSDNHTLCFKPDSVKMNNSSRTELTPEGICRRAVAKGYEDFYFPLVEGKQLRCVTNCTSGLDGAINCNQGQCILERSGPTCRCFSSDTHWFSGPRCEVAIHWRALVGGLAGAAVLLLLLVLGLGCLAARSRSRRGSRLGSESQDGKWADFWNEEVVGTFSNLGFEHDGTVKDENFQIVLENVDTNVTVQIQRPEVAFSSI